MKPHKIKIVKCTNNFSSSKLWYNDKIGEIFELSTNTPEYDELYRILDKEKGIFLYVYRIDAILLNREEKLKRILQCH